MIKKISTIALAAMLAMPGMASAGGVDDLAAQIDRLSQELSKLKQEMAEIKDQAAETEESLDERGERWDLSSRIQISGDFRARGDWASANSVQHWTTTDVGKGMAYFMNPSQYAGNNLFLLAGFYQQEFGMPAGFGAGSSGEAATAQLNTLITGDPTLNGGVAANALPAMQRIQNLANFMRPGTGFTPAQRSALFQGLGTPIGDPQGFDTKPAADYENDTIYTNRFRLNIRAQATEDLEFKGRLAMYKTWGMDSNPVNPGSGLYDGPYKLSAVTMDGNRSRAPETSLLYVDRAFLNWNDIGGLPMWFSIGRRPTTDGPPAQLRLGADKRLATPVNFMDYAFDGISLGYAYDSLFNFEDVPGRIRLCYGRGFEAGPNGDDSGINDVDFVGLSWDVFKTENRFMNIQSFLAMNMMNVPDGVNFTNPIEQAFLADGTYSANLYDPNYNNGILDIMNLGNIYHTSAVYLANKDNFNYFMTLGWSRTEPNGHDEMGVGLLSSWWDPDYGTSKDGYSAYMGMRYDFPDAPFKLGLEYNYGSKNWIAFTPAHDDLYASKLATRGHVVEAYTIWDVPAGEAVSKFGKAFVRLGFQHYEYNYTGSGSWLGEPIDIDDLKNDPWYAQFYTPLESHDQIYLSLEAWF